MLASEDPDFPEGTQFVHQVSADESPIDVAALLDFANKLRERSPDYMMDMRRYAEGRLTWKAKLEPIVDYVRTGELGDTT